MVDMKQPRALYLADVLSAGFECDQEWYELESARELRRLHAENEDYGSTIDYLTCENAEQIGEIVELKEQRDELLEALKRIAMAAEAAVCNVEWIAHHARAAIAKAGGAA